MRAYLGGTTNGVTIWNIYSELLNLLSHSDGYLIKRGIPIELTSGEIDCFVNSLCQRSGIGPKPVTNVVNRFVELGLIRITPSKLASIADMASVVGWTDEDGYHEIDRNSGRQNPIVENNKSDEVLDESFPFNQSQEETKHSRIGEQESVIDSPVCQDEENHFGNRDNVQMKTGKLQQLYKRSKEDSSKGSEWHPETHVIRDPNTLYNMDAHEVPVKRDSEETPSSDISASATTR